MLASSTLAVAFAGYFMMRDRFYDNRKGLIILAFAVTQLAKLPKICEELIATEVGDIFLGM
jgi:hypothetical protein